MRYLPISLCLFLVGCASYPKKNNFREVEITAVTVLNPYFSDETKDYIYKAQIEVYGEHIGGIFIVKKISKDEHRVVFTTEMGNKIFDFSYTKDDFKVNFILSKLDKKLLINLLKKDFKVLIDEHPFVLKSFSLKGKEIIETEVYDKKHYYYYSNQQLKKVIKVIGGKEKTVFIFSEINANLANEIHIIHSKIKINLKSI